MNMKRIKMKRSQETQAMESKGFDAMTLAFFSCVYHDIFSTRTILSPLLNGKVFTPHFLKTGFCLALYIKTHPAEPMQGDEKTLLHSRSKINDKQ
jgi:hypothetical protein